MRDVRMERLNSSSHYTVTEMTIKPIVLDDLTPLWKLQLVMLGVLIGNKGLRKHIESDCFTDEEIRKAVSDIKGEEHKTGTGYFNLKCVLEKMNVEWGGSDSGPLPEMFAQLKLNHKYNEALVALNSVFVGTTTGDNKAKQAVVDAVRNMGLMDGGSNE